MHCLHQNLTAYKFTVAGCHVFKHQNIDLTILAALVLYYCYYLFHITETNSMSLRDEHQCNWYNISQISFDA